MQFSEKLDFMMKITNTTNSALASNTSLDASYISRLRRGVRSLPKSENYVAIMAEYFARHALEDYQIKALRDILPGAYSVSNNCNENAESIRIWLQEHKAGEVDSVQGLLDIMENFQFRKPQQWNSIENDDYSSSSKSLVSIYYGMEGKQQAALAFLSSVINCKRPQTLLLFSDESFDWLSQNPQYAARWAAMMSQVIMQGNRIKMIHTVSRHLDEMLVGLAKWIPLYMTGAIDPYHYPKKRDGLFKRTLFIAPETAAVIATSIGNMEDEAANFLIKDKKAVEALVSEYNNLAALCRPLMRIFNPGKSQAYKLILSEFEQEPADAIIKTGSFYLLTMPDTVADSIIARMEESEKDEMTEHYRLRKQNFLRQLQHHNFIEIITMPAADKIKNGKLRVSLSDTLNTKDLFYTPDELVLHLENIILLLQTWDNYHVYIDSSYEQEGFMLYAKEDVGAIVAKTSAPAITFAINENNMTAAFWDYLNGKINRIDDWQLNKNTTIKRLQSLIDKIK